MSSLELRGVSKGYTLGKEVVRVLDNVRHTFPARGAVAILGRSGVGKSTLLHLIAGIDEVDSGQIIYGGSDLVLLSDTERSKWRRNTLGFIFQFHHLLPEFSALENVAMPLWTAARHSQQDPLERAQVVLDTLGLSHRYSHQPGELSGGEQQRVAIARALVGGPKLILADEPTGNLDAATAQVIESVLLEQARELGALLIVVTHSKELAARLDFQLEMVEGGHLREV